MNPSIETKTLHIFMIGVGQIGGTLLKLIQRQAAFLIERIGLELKVIGLANSRKMHFNEDGVDLTNWKENLDASNKPFSILKFVEKMLDLSLSNTIFIDSTASAEVTDFYEQILAASINISTFNKIAASSSLIQYNRLKEIAARRRVFWRYETNVGAGLPILSTLGVLVHSGDRILKIEGVLSGTLSYIFNNFCQQVLIAKPVTNSQLPPNFSQLVRIAQSLGLTEPDPRNDLSGVDVRRKLLILARETGLQLEADDIVLEQFLPPACMTAPSIETFFEELEKHNEYFETMRLKAAGTNQVLRFVAKLENGQASISLQAVSPGHPFHALNDSDNMVIFTTDRYYERPLVVSGPGAGAEVTAARVFAELIEIASHFK